MFFGFLKNVENDENVEKKQVSNVEFVENKVIIHGATSSSYGVFSKERIFDIITPETMNHWPTD